MPIHGFDSIQAANRDQLHLQTDHNAHEKHEKLQQQTNGNAEISRNGDYSANWQLSSRHTFHKLQQSAAAAALGGDPEHSITHTGPVDAHNANAGPSSTPAAGSGLGHRVVRILNGPLHTTPNDALAPHASYNQVSSSTNVHPPLMQRAAPFQLSTFIPASHGGPHVGGHYGAHEGAINKSSLRAHDAHFSDLPAPEWDDVRGHGMNAFYRYRVNMPVRERIIMSRAPPPYFVRQYPRASAWALNLFRIILLCWTVVFIVGIFRIRYHYGADVFVAIFMTTLIVCNEKLLQSMVPYLYLPVDARYADAPMYPFAIDPQLYEETLSKVGVGGLI